MVAGVNPLRLILLADAAVLFTCTALVVAYAAGSAYLLITDRNPDEIHTERSTP